MKIAFDTNVVLDLILERPGHEAALKLALEIAAERVTGLISANSITDIYYIARKSIGDEKAREAIADILVLFDVCVVNGDICFAALNTPMRDFEDAVLAVSAAKEGADYIATCNQDFLHAESPVPALAPSELLKLLEL